MRRRSPDCRTVPSSTAETPSSAPIARMSCGFPLRANADVREAMRRPSTLVSALISSSLMPSLRYSLSGSALAFTRSEEHTSELQSPCNLVCRLLLEKKQELVLFHLALGRSYRRATRTQH